LGASLGIGAGPQGKTPPGAKRPILRRGRHKPPAPWMAAAGTAQAVGGDDRIAPEQRPFEYMLNALRLHEGFALADFQVRTGLDAAHIAPALEQARQRGWLELGGGRVRPTALGRRFANDVIELFL